MTGPSKKTLEMIATYEAGASTKEVAARFDCSIRNVQLLIAKHAPALKRRRDRNIPPHRHPTRH